MTSNVLCSAGKGEQTIPACLDCALSGNPPCGYDYTLVKSLVDSREQEKRMNEIHVTDLTGCLRKAYLDKIGATPEYVHEKLIRWLGVQVHGAAETNDQNVECELPVTAEGITGRIDTLYKDGRLVDNKTTRWMIPAKLPYGSHALQVNIYAWMLRKSGRAVTSLQIHYIDLSGPTKCRACKVPVRMIAGEIKCPDCLQVPSGAHLGAMLVDIPLMTDEEVEARVLERRDILVASLALRDMPDPEPGYLCSYCAHYQKVCLV